MKIRQGFVSNSSASSFVCGFCGQEAGGWDGEYGFEVLTCKNWHSLCGEHVTNRPEDGFEDPGDIPAEYCPLCNFEEVAITDANSYVYKIAGYSQEKAKEEIKEKFKNYQEFSKWLKI